MRVVKVTGFNEKSIENVDAYRKRKIKIMKRDFCITLTKEEIAHINELKSIGQIDAYCIYILNDRWG